MVRRVRTRGADVVGLEVGFEVLRAGLGAGEQRVGDGDLTGLAARTARVSQLQHLRGRIGGLGA